MMIATLLLSSVTVTLSGDVVVGGTEISLGDVAQVSGEDAALVARLEGLSLGYAPAPGYTRVFPQWKIESLLRGEAPGQELELAGEAVCRVSPRTTRISGDALLAEARTAAQELLVGEDFELSTPEPLEDELVPEGRRGVELRAAAARATRVSASTAGRWSMPIEPCGTTTRSSDRAMSTRAKPATAGTIKWPSPIAAPVSPAWHRA